MVEQENGNKMTATVKPDFKHVNASMMHVVCGLFRRTLSASSVLMDILFICIRFYSAFIFLVVYMITAAISFKKQNRFLRRGSRVIRRMN